MSPLCCVEEFAQRNKRAGIVRVLATSAGGVSMRALADFERAVLVLEHLAPAEKAIADYLYGMHQQNGPLDATACDPIKLGNALFVTAVALRDQAEDVQNFEADQLVQIHLTFVRLLPKNPTAAFAMTEVLVALYAAARERVDLEQPFFRILSPAQALMAARRRSRSPGPVFPE